MEKKTETEQKVRINKTKTIQLLGTPAGRSVIFLQNRKNICMMPWLSVRAAVVGCNVALAIGPTVFIAIRA